MEPHDVVRHRPFVFDKMEALAREMQDPENGVPVRSQKIFLTSVPSAFMGYDLIEWLMERHGIEESEALNLANQLCQYGYFFPIADCKVLVVKDDSSLYRFQSPYYWPWQQRSAGGGASGGVGGSVPPPPPAPPPATHPDNVEYAIYLCKRTKRNRQRHVLDEYEAEALASLRKNLQAKWDFINMHANEQVRLAKERKKGDKIVVDSQERAYWRVYRPPPGYYTALESCPVPSRCRARCKRRDIAYCRQQVEFLKSCTIRTRVKMSVALDSMVQHAETFAEYDPMISPPLPTNPWVTDDLTYWQLNGSVVEVPTEKRVRRWAVSIEELVSDPTGLLELTAYLRKEYSHENIRFWMAVNDLRRSAASQIQRKVNEIYDEFLAPGAPCEINIDGKTMERVQQEIKNPSRFSFDSAADHVYALLLKKDCYPRFIRSDHYKNLLAAGKQPLQKKRFFGFGGPAKKKSSTTAPPLGLLQQGSGMSGATGSVATGTTVSAGAQALARRRGSDRSLSGSAHELAVAGRDTHVPHSHSQSNLSDIPYRVEGISGGSSSGADETAGAVCPWDVAVPERLEPTPRSRNNSAIDSCSSSSDISVAIVEVSERLRRSCGLPQQSTLDGEKRAPPPARRLSAFEPRRGPPSVPGLRDEFPHCSFDSSTVTTLSRDNDNDNNASEPDEEAQVKNLKKAPSLLKSFSVSSAAPMVAPVISVSSAHDDVAAAADLNEATEQSATRISVENDTPQIVEEASDSPSTIGMPSSNSLTPSPISPVSNTSTACETSSETVVDEPDDHLTPLLTECERVVVLVTAFAPLAESEDAAEEDETDANPAIDFTSTTTALPLAVTDNTINTQQSLSKDEKDNDVCPWEDEETCKMDTPFVKTYATFGYL
ncbi:uncharacterized protein LOC143920792 isoform X2 [Arctopsyche grandis]|uniref:uncharacterized protein LOC143920792 isoform X2 n=1 Tax=Arctopsyche grandis TaxID=121162 RepID=UPI00406D6CA6